MERNRLAGRLKTKGLCDEGRLPEQVGKHGLKQKGRVDEREHPCHCLGGRLDTGEMRDAGGSSP